MRWYAIVAVATVSFFVACGDDSAREREISQTVEEFVLAIFDDPPKAYTYLSEGCKEQVGFLQFATGLSIFDGILGDSEPETVDLEIVERDGDTAIAEFEVVIFSEDEEIPLMQGLGDQGTARFVKEDGRWRIDECGLFSTEDEFGEAPPLPEPADADPSLIAARAAEADSRSDLPGELIDLATIYGGPYPDTASHITGSARYDVEQGLPPAGGPHWGSNPCGGDPAEAPPLCGPVPWGFFVAPWPAESLVHNMEHSGVVVWYNTREQDIIEDLADFAEDNQASLLVISPYPDMESETVAITSWSRRLTMSIDDYERDLLQEFFDVHHCRFDPEQFC